MIKGLVISSLVAGLGAIQFELGPYNAEQKTWRTYNPICDKQCLSSNCTICGVNVRKCRSADKCVDKLGFKIC